MPAYTTPSPLRLVHYFPDMALEAGGVVHAVLDLCDGLASAGHDVTLVTCPPCEVPKRWSAGQPGAAKLLQLSAPLGALGRLPAPALSEALAAMRTADAVHLHTPWEPSNIQLAKQLRKLGRPYVVTIHGMLTDWSMGQKTLKKRVFLRCFARDFIESAAAVQFTAAAEAKQAKKWIPGATARVVPLVFHAEPYQCLPRAEEQEQALRELGAAHPLLLFLSRLHPVKGAELLIEAAALLQQRGVSYHAVLAGPGNDAYVAGLRALVAARGLKERISFPGMVGGSEKISLFAAADVFALPSGHENFGLVLVEAMACATSVVTTRQVNIWQELEQGGGVVVPRTAADIADAIEALLTDAPRRERLAASGRQWVLDWLAPSRVLPLYEQMYGA